MPAIPCNPSRASWSGPNAGSFNPYGKLDIISYGGPGTLGAAAWESANSRAARLFVGFSVGQQPRYSMDDLIPIVRDVRLLQAPADPSASFVAQQGIYRYKHDGDIVEEDGAQVIIIAPAGTAGSQFKAEMIALGEEIARKLHQELIVLELQHNGLIEVTIGVVP